MLYVLQGRMQDARTTVYKKKDIIYNLKMKASRRKYKIHPQFEMSDQVLHLNSFKYHEKKSLNFRQNKKSFSVQIKF